MTSTAIDRALAKFQMSYTFDESKVARDDDGRFTSKGGSGGAPSFRTPALREPSPGPTIERRSLTRGESWQRVGTKIGDFPKEYVEDSPATEESPRGRDRVYATREAPVDWFKAPPKIDWQVPPDMPVEKHVETVGALKRIISGTRQDAITKARETRQKVAVHGIKDKFTAKRRTGDLILPEDTPAGAANRAYNHAAMLALHDFGVIDYDFQMSDAQKEELTPLIPFMRYARRRLGAEMRSGSLKGATAPYRAAFGTPFKDERRHKVTGDVRLRVRPNDVLVKRDLGRPRYITADELRALADEADDPTPAQAAAGNYRMGHVRVGGLPIAIETPMGRDRRGVDPDGEEWSVTMQAHYGYVKGTEGADEDPVDVYLGPLAHEAELHPVFVIDQVDADSGDFDEHKVMLGFATRPEALRTYDAGFSDGRGPERRDTVTRLTFEEFKDWIGEGDTMAPMGKAAPRGCADERVAMMMGDADRILAEAEEKQRPRWRGVTDPDVEALMPEVDRLIGRPRPPETPERRMARSKMIGDPRIPLATVLGKAFDESKVKRDEDGKFASMVGRALGHNNRGRGRGRFASEDDGGAYERNSGETTTTGAIAGATIGAAAVSAPYAIYNTITGKRIALAGVTAEHKREMLDAMREARRTVESTTNGHPEELARAAHRKVMEEAKNRGGDMAEAARDADRMAARVRRMKERSADGFKAWMKGQRAALDALKRSRSGARNVASHDRVLMMIPNKRVALAGGVAGGLVGAALASRSYDHSAALSAGDKDERTPAVIVGDAIRHVGPVATAAFGGLGLGALTEAVINRPLPKAGRWAAVIIPAAGAGAYNAYSFAQERREARRLALEGRA